MTPLNTQFTESTNTPNTPPSKIKSDQSSPLNDLIKKKGIKTPLAPLPKSNIPYLAEGQLPLPQKPMNPITEAIINLRDYRIILDSRKIARRLGTAAISARIQQYKETESTATTLPLLTDHHPQKSFGPSGILNLKRSDPIEYHTDSDTIENTGHAEAQGYRPSMEDAVQIASFNFLTKGEEQPATVTAVFDGHGGDQASRVCSALLVKALKHRLEEYATKGLSDANTWNALKIAMVDLDRQYQGKDGTTANVALKIGSDLWIANVGDSRAVLTTPEGIAVQLSEDAKPEGKYLSSIEGRGGIVFPVYGVPRVNGYLAVARALGDHRLEGAVCPRPKIVKYQLPADSSGYQLVQCCDGVFDVLTSKQVGEIAFELKKQGYTPAQTAALLVKQAYDNGSKDNITALIRHL